MGVAKSWRFSLTPAAAKLVLLQNHHGYNGGGGGGGAPTNKQLSLRSPRNAPYSPRQRKQQQQAAPATRRWSLVCGLMLFGLGLVSLFTGHVASDLEWWYSQRVANHGFYLKLVINTLSQL